MCGHTLNERRSWTRLHTFDTSINYHFARSHVQKIFQHPANLVLLPPNNRLTNPSCLCFQLISHLYQQEMQLQAKTSEGMKIKVDIPSMLQVIIGNMKIKVYICPLFIFICGNFWFLMPLKPCVILPVVSP